MAVCGLCFGTGHVIGEGGAPCGRCGGSGFVENDDDEYDDDPDFTNDCMDDF